MTKKLAAETTSRHPYSLGSSWTLALHMGVASQFLGFFDAWKLSPTERSLVLDSQLLLRSPRESLHGLVRMQDRGTLSESDQRAVLLLCAQIERVSSFELRALLDSWYGRIRPFWVWVWE